MKKFLSLLAIISLVIVFAIVPAFAQVDLPSAPSWLSRILAVLKDIDKYVDLLNSLLVAVIAIALILPGDQPEKFLKQVVEFLSKFSKKPKV